MGAHRKAPRSRGSKLRMGRAIGWAAAIALAAAVCSPVGAAPLPVFAEIPAPTGAPVAGKTLTTANDEVNIISRAQGQKIGIPAAFPDVHPTYLRFDDGSIRF